MKEGDAGGNLIRRLHRLVETIASGRVLAVLTVLAVLFPVVVFPAHGIGELRPLDLYFFYRPDQAYEFLAALGADGRRAYVGMLLTSDMAFPVIYSLALSVLLMLVLRKVYPPASRLRSLCLFPFLAAIADGCENLGLAAATAAFPGRLDAMVRFAAFFTSLKWMLVAFTVLILLLAFTVRLGRDLDGSKP